MARSLSSAVQAELAKQGVRVVLFVEVNVYSGPIRLWSGFGPITWNSLQWSGVGNLGKISAMPETSEVQAQGCTLSLSGIPSDMLAYALGEIRQGKTATIWVGFLDSSENVIADPTQSFSGRVDVPTVDESGDTCTITISVESELITLQRPRERRYTAEDQKIDYPTDLGFDFVASLQEKNLVWGKGQNIPQSAGNSSQVSPSQDHAAHYGSFAP